MLPALRKALLTFHIAVSVGWLGALLAYLPLDVTASWSDDVVLVRAAYVAMDLIARWAIVPLALAALASGVLVALTTRWGLLQHHWVVLSLALTALAVGVLLVEAPILATLAAAAADPARADADVLALPGTLPHSLGGLVVLLVVLSLNVVKPPGLTRRGWREQQGRR